MPIFLATTFILAVYCGDALAADYAPGRIIAAGISAAVIGAIFAALYGLRRLVTKWWTVRRQ